MSITNVGTSIGTLNNHVSLSACSFIHSVTGEKRSTKPLECRGGILADEMGMPSVRSLLI